MFTPYGVAIIAILALLLFSLTSIRRTKRIKLELRNDKIGTCAFDIEAAESERQIEAERPTR